MATPRDFFPAAKKGGASSKKNIGSLHIQNYSESLRNSLIRYCDEDKGAFNLLKKASKGIKINGK